jgi:translation initiation factor IF-2
VKAGRPTHPAGRPTRAKAPRPSGTRGAHLGAGSGRLGPLSLTPRRACRPRLVSPNPDPHPESGSAGRQGVAARRAGVEPGRARGMGRACLDGVDGPGWGGLGWGGQPGWGGPAEMGPAGRDWAGRPGLSGPAGPAGMGQAAGFGRTGRDGAGWPGLGRPAGVEQASGLLDRRDGVGGQGWSGPAGCGRQAGSGRPARWVLLG